MKQGSRETARMRIFSSEYSRDRDWEQRERARQLFQRVTETAVMEISRGNSSQEWMKDCSERKWQGTHKICSASKVMRRVNSAVGLPQVRSRI